MKRIRTLATAVLTLALTLCLLLSTVRPVYAAAPDVGDYLAKILGVSKTELSNYATNYSASLPITYEKTSKSCYAALGGETAYGQGVGGDFSKCYADLIKASYGFTNYKPVGKQAGLTASEAVDYINGVGDRDKTVPNAIKAADFITFQIDGVALMAASKITAEGVLTGGSTLNWNKYVTNSATLAELKDISNKIVAEYGDDFGKSNAEKISQVLECMLYECTVYCHETMNAVKAIRSQNGSAVILVVGLYNPLRNLSLTAEGQTIYIGDMVNDMIQVCNAYLLKQTASMKNTAFIDVSKASTNGFSNVTLDLNDSNAISGKLLPILTDVDKQYANKSGHAFIAEQVKNATKAPCKHTKTTVLNKKDATCTEKGYSGDTKCLDCNTIIKQGSATNKAPHNYGAWTQLKAPTCTEKGQRTHTCSDCKYTETVDINAAGHKWDEGTVIKQADCKNSGETKHTCTVCTATKTETVPPVEHTWDAGVVTKEPDCQHEGERKHTCSVCSATKVEPVPTADHKWDAGTETKHPTCAEEGEMTYTCTVCTATKTDPIPTTEHNYGDYTSNGDATCLQDGTKSATCADCGAVDTVADAGSQLEHQYQDGVCTLCKAAEPTISVTTVIVIMSCVTVAAAGGSGFLGFWLAKKKFTAK